MQHEVLEVIFHSGWKVALEGREFGPYSSEEEAVETAKSWAENAGKQGHTVSVLIRSGCSHPTPPMH